MIRSLSLSAAALALAAPAAAQEAFALDEIVVSGGLTPVEASAFGRAVSILTEEDIERRGAATVAEALRGLPGVAVTRTGGEGGVTQVRLRGAEANHTLVLIDGVEVSEPNIGEFDFGGLLAGDIARIEVLRGPQSALYGSNAIGGVISITTKRATEPGFSGEAEIEGGTDETLAGRVALGFSGERGRARFSAARRETGGFDISGDPGGADDGSENLTLNVNGSLDVAAWATVGGTLRYVDRETDFDGFAFGAADSAGLVVDADNVAEVEELYGALFAEAELLGGRVETRLDLGYADIDRLSTSAGTPTADSSSLRRKAALQATAALDAATLDAARHTLTLAVEAERESYRENDPDIVFDPGQLNTRERDQIAYIAEYRGSLAFGLDVQASARFDDNDAFEDFATYAVGLSYTLPNGTTRLHASAGTGVQNPTLIEQFGFFDDFAGNPDLEPEQSRGFDLGVEQTFLDGRAVVDVTYFREVLTDEITSVFDPATGTSTPVNQTGDSDRQGVEVAAAFAPTDRIDLGLTYTYLDATDPDGQVEIRRPEHALGATASWLLPNDRTRVSGTVRYVSGLFDLDFTSPSLGSERVRLDDYAVVDLAFRHDFGERAYVRGAVENLFDADYEELDGYETQGRTLRVAVGVTF